METQGPFKKYIGLYRNMYIVLRDARGFCRGLLFQECIPEPQDLGLGFRV